MKQGSWTKMFVLLFATVIPLLSFGLASDSGSTATPDHIALTWTGNPSTTMTITWRTDSTVTSGFVRYQKGAKLSKKAKQVKAESRDFITDLGSARLFTSTLVNISPNSKYLYRVGDGEHWSDGGTFSTAGRKTSGVILQGVVQCL
jgi:hypothetical protein